MKAFIVALAFGVALPVSAFAQDAPPFLKAIEPQAAVNSAWQEWMAVFNPKGALDGKTKELIGLAVAAQIPCQYCVYAHTVGAKHAGATDEQIKEAVAASGAGAKNEHGIEWQSVRHGEFKKQIDAAYSLVKRIISAGGAVKSAPPLTASFASIPNSYLLETETGRLAR